MVKKAAESAMREVIGRTELQPALTEARQQIETNTLALLQLMLDEYQTGVQVTQVQLQKADPPAPVIDAFNDVQREQYGLFFAVSSFSSYCYRRHSGWLPWISRRSSSPCSFTIFFNQRNATNSIASDWRYCRHSTLFGLAKTGRLRFGYLHYWRQ